jgi:putative membrane-bound dehydrogenase-like protein
MPKLTTLTLLAAALAAAAAPAPEPIPASSRRPVIVSSSTKLSPPVARLPAGYALSVAAAAPLVTHPIAGCFDDRGRLFVGDAVGVNWKKEHLEANPPNRVVMLEDADGDGDFDKSTVFADQLTFPSGAQWLDGSLYVASPPGIWKLTDTDGDGVADRREMIASGFDYTGNAADVHGPFLHPDGRLYWCHGRKGYQAAGKDGKVVFEGKSSGIWSIRPDGTDLRWHSLLAGDNPVEVDFTPQGEIVGVQNLYYNQPRGDTLVHWLYGGVYARADLPQVIAGLPRTLPTMPVMHNFGHVAVSGACFWKNYPETRGADAPLQFLVTHFNTQRVVRMELSRDGATYRAVENEFLKLTDPDAHFTDVIEAPDGSIIVLDTGGWFRLGCPSSLLAKPDVLGRVLRIRPSAPVVKNPGAWSQPYRPIGTTTPELIAGLEAADAQVRLRALARVAEARPHDVRVTAAVLGLMSKPLDAPNEHALIFAAQNLGAVDRIELLREAKDPAARRRLLAAYRPRIDSYPPAHRQAAAELSAYARSQLDADDADLAAIALKLLADHPEANAGLAEMLVSWLEDKTISENRQRALREVALALPGRPEVQAVTTAMLRHASPAIRRLALGTIAVSNAKPAAEWTDELLAMLGRTEGPSPLLLDAIKRLRSAKFDAPLQAVADDVRWPTALRLRALDSMQARAMTPQAFTLLLTTLTQDASVAARIQAASMLSSTPLTPAQTVALAPALAQAGPIELRELIKVLRRTPAKEAQAAEALVNALARNPALISQQESVYRTALSEHPPRLFEDLILPARQKAEAAMDQKKRSLGDIAEAATLGSPSRGQALFAAGRGTCVACHKVGDLGRAIGPDLSKIGAIRTERDLAESIVFPSSTLARDYEAHLFELNDGQTALGVVRSHTAEGLRIVDVSGQERTLPHAQIASDTVLTESLMPMGLDATLSAQELADLIAWLRSLR